MRRWLAVSLAASLVGALLSSAPALAQPGATGGTVPEAPNIVDPASDANHHSPITGQAGPPSMNGADILAVWFSADAENLYVHVQTTNGARLESLRFTTSVGPAPETDCIQLRMTTEGQGVESFSAMDLSGDCGDETTSFGPLLEEEGPDGTAILTGAFPRSANAAFADGQTLHGPSTLVGYFLRDAGRVGVIDGTDVGTNYEVKSGGSEASPPNEEPPGKDDPPGKGKKKGCKKGKGNKKGACRKPEPAPQACAAYAPGEQGAEAATTVVTDEATAEKPIEIPVATEAGIPEEGVTHVFHNIQVDSSAPTTGLHARFEFDFGQDYDIYLNNAAGEEQAQAAGTNQALVIPGEPYGQDNDEGGHSEPDAEALDGITTADCGGYTMDIASYFSEGGEYTLKLWLGEAAYTPGGGELQDAALSLF